MKIIVCGSGRSQNQQQVFAALDALHAQTPITLLINGGARGVDLFASQWARSNEVPLKTYKARHWEKGRQAFFDLNQQMIAENGPDLVLAFPGGAVSDHLLALARQNGIDVQLVE